MVDYEYGNRFRRIAIYGAAVVVVIVMAAVIVLVSSGWNAAPASTTTLLTTIASTIATTTVPTTTMPTTTMPSITTTVQIQQSPMVKYFSLFPAGIIILNASQTAAQGGAEQGSMFRYFGSNATKGITSNYTLIVKVLVYANQSGMASEYGVVSAGLNNSTTPFSNAEISAAADISPFSLNANMTGGAVKTSPSGVNFYILSAYYSSSSAVVTASLTVPSSVVVPPGVALGSLLNAVSAAQPS